jgi:chorismate mutase
MQDCGVSRVGAVALVGVLAVAAPVSARADVDFPLDVLVGAAVERLQTADPVAAAKWRTRGDIEDPRRVNEVLAAVSAAANARGIDPGYVTGIFGDQISATEAVEYSRFAQWKLDPTRAPTSAPDLSASRSAIDALNQQMVDEIATHWELLHSPGCRAALQDAMNNVVAARQLDGLYQEALAAATRSYCA